ncbi:MAG: hypothetical protein DLM62_04110 [Pseudonocardiales bacterium]|nr:MAG: hypothetical protein DLM62_04110 [Pseudonocardiales bacterium]
MTQVWQKYAAAPLTVGTQASFGTVTGEVPGGLLTFAGPGPWQPSAAGIFSSNSGPFSPGRDEHRNARDPASPGLRLQPQHAAYRRQPAGRRESGDYYATQSLIITRGASTRPRPAAAGTHSRTTTWPRPEAPISPARCPIRPRRCSP